MLRRLEWIAALAILLSCALPFSLWGPSPADVAASAGSPIPPSIVFRPIDELALAVHDRLYVIDTSPTVIAFVWPLAVAALFAAWPRLRSVRALRALQLILLAGSAWLVALLGSMGHPARGFYVACLALALYAVIWALDVHRTWTRAVQSTA